MGKTEREVENLTHAAARLELKSASASASSAARLAMGALQVQPLHAPTHSSHIPGSGSSRTVRKGSVDAASSNAPRPAPSAAAAGSGAGGAVDTARSRVVVDIGKYDGSMERDERRGRRTGDFSAAQLEAMALDSANTTAHSVTRKWNVNSFETGRAMGKGRFGRVYIARTKPDENGQHGDFIVALKLMYKREVAQGGLERQIRREVEIQQTLRHPHVLRLYGYFHDEGRIFLMLEFAARGEMYKIMSKLPHNHWTEKQAARYTGQMADGLAYLHSKHIIHRDIKPENLLVGLNDDLKIADFGWSVHAQGDRRRTSCGTLDYMPPEMTRGESHGHQVDLWAFGVLIYEFIVGFPPFDSLNPENEQRDAAERVPGQTNPYTHRRIQKQDYVFPADFPRDCADLVWRLLRNDASKRLPLDMLLQHPWLTKFEPQVYARAKKAGYLKDTPAHKRPPSPSTPILFERR